MSWESLAPITHDDLADVLTHERVTALSFLPWVAQVMRLTELLGRPDIEQQIDDSWDDFSEFGERLHDEIKTVLGVSLVEVGGLRSLMVEHSEEVEYECIRAGVRLRDLGGDRLTYRDLLVIVKHCPPASPLAGALHPQAAWSTSDHLLAFAIDAIRGLAWTTAGNNDAPRPDPIPRPGDPPRVSSVEHHRERAEYYARKKAAQQAQLET